METLIFERILSSKHQFQTAQENTFSKGDWINSIFWTILTVQEIERFRGVW